MFQEMMPLAVGGGIDLQDLLSNAVPFSVTWYTNSQGGLTIPTTKKAKAILGSLSNNVNSYAMDDGKFYYNHEYDSNRPFTFNDNSVRCSVQISNSNMEYHGFIIYED